MSSIDELKNEFYYHLDAIRLDGQQAMKNAMDVIDERLEKLEKMFDEVVEKAESEREKK